MTTTKALERIAEIQAQVDPASTRGQALAAIRAFRLSWIELGRLLIEIAYGGDYKEWGFEEFELYCARELGLKKPTVRKLMISYQYLKAHRAGVLSGPARRILR